MRKRIVASIVTVALSTLLIGPVAPANAHKRFKVGKYSCYNYGVYPAWPVMVMKFSKSGSYEAPLGSGEKGRWRHNSDGARIKFLSGPLDDDSLRMTHSIDDGDHWTKMKVLKKDKWEYAYSCYWYS